MTGLSSAYYEELQGRIRGLLITVSDQLPPYTVGLVDRMIEANECGVALETISDMLVESSAVLPAEVLEIVEGLVTMMELNPLNVEQLRPLVDAPDTCGPEPE